MAGLQKILLVEDNTELSHIYVTFLTQHGFEMATAFDGEEALQMAMTFKPDLVFLDIMMPKKDGFQVLKLLRNDDKYGCTHARIVMLTNIGDATKLDPSMQDDIDGYVVKAEIVLQDLLDIIASFDQAAAAASAQIAATPVVPPTPAQPPVSTT